MTVGYSGTPVPKKLGLKAPMRLVILDAPTEYEMIVGPLPEGIKLSTVLSENVDLVHIFASSRATLSAHLVNLRHQLKDNVVVWVSWPKKASKVATDITEDTIRELALPLGYVDIKVCAVSEIWSGLKLVVRKALRDGAKPGAS